MKRIFFIILLSQLFSIRCIKAQIDPHFSQYYAYPLWLNPALTGYTEGSVRITGNFKNQWANIGEGYQTKALSVDARIGEKVGAGLTVLNQNAGSAGFRYLTAYGSLSYNITLSTDGVHKLRFGLQAGIINRNIDPGKFQMGNQYNAGLGFDPTLPSGENFSNTGSRTFDAATGLFYSATNESSESDTWQPFAGISFAHISSFKDHNSKNLSYIKPPFRYTAHGGVKILASESIYMTPHFLFISQDKNKIKAAGLQSEFAFSDNQSLFLGYMARIKDSSIASIGYEVGQLAIGTSYDFNTSSLTKASNGRGGIEIAVTYTFKSSDNSPLNLCPRF